MSGEATTELTQVGDVDLNELLHVNAPSQEEASEDVEERSDDSSEPESDQRDGAKDDVAQQYELRMRGLQAAKDREIAAAKAEAQKLREATEVYERTMLDIAKQQARAQYGEAGAVAVQQQYDMARYQQQLQTAAAQMQQQWNAQQTDAAQLLAWKLASDPKYQGIDADELLQQWGGFGPQAMVRAAEMMALGKRAENIKTRKAKKADSMGGGTGGAGDVTSTMSGVDLIDFALKNSKRKPRWE